MNQKHVRELLEALNHTDQCHGCFTLNPALIAALESAGNFIGMPDADRWWRK